MNIEQLEKSSFVKEIIPMVDKMNSMRSDTKNGAVDVSLAEMVKHSHGVSLESYFEDLGIDPNIDTIENMVNLPETSVRWLIPEIFREALSLGLRKSPIYPNIIAAEITVPQTTITMPWFDMSDAAPKTVGIAETIPFGNISFNSKQVSIKKMGRGIQIPDEVKQYTSLNVVALFMQDFGVKLGMGMDSAAIDVLINGEQSNGSESAAVIGVASASTLAYKDILKVWLRMARIGRTPDTMIGGEDAALLTLDLNEFKKSGNSAAPLKTLDLKTPIPTRANYFIHSAIPASQQIILDSGSVLMKLNAIPLKVESKREVSNQTEAYYASLTTGFCTVYRDGRVILDHSVAFSGNGFPTWMDPSTQEKTIIN